MERIHFKFAAYDKAIEPQAIRISTDGWGGLPQKMVDGSQPQPWHCLPFVEGSIYGLELIYPYETECRVVHEAGTIRFDWDYAKEPGVELTGGEFIAFSPRNASKYYLFNTKLDVQPPPGYVVRTEPHPRFFTNDEPDVPMAMVGHLQNEWFTRRLFVVFRSPRKGETHVFRKGEAYAQILFVPQRVTYEMEKMTAEEEATRRRIEKTVDRVKSEIADNIWHSPAGAEFSNYYKVLARAFGRDGMKAVEELINLAEGKHTQALPADKSIAECLALGQQKLNQRMNDEARAIFQHVLEREPNNAEALSNLGICAASMGHVTAALHLMARAVEVAPRSPLYHANLGEMLRRVGRLTEAEASLRAAVGLDPRSPQLRSLLGLIIAPQGRVEEAVQLCRGAVAQSPQSPVAVFRLGVVLAQRGELVEARRCLESAIAMNPNYAEARMALEELRGKAPSVF